MKEDTEINIIKYLQQLPSKYKNIVTKLMRLISSLFHCKLYIIIVLFLYLIEKINTFQVFILFSSQFIIFTIKYIIKRERPFIVDKDIKLLELMNFDTYSFPSGHTLNAFLLSYILQKNIGINLSFLPYLVGLSRMYLGVHYPTDIVGSLILSKIILYLHNF